VLTVVVPTRDRPGYCASLLRFLRTNRFPYRILVLDGSNEPQAQAVRSACAGVAEYRQFGPTFRLVDMLVDAVGAVETPYIILMPDDDPIMPHAVDAELAFLQQHPDYIAAHGYFLGFGLHGDDLDIHHILGFTPSIESDRPLIRHATLFQRYQSFYWGVFRTEVFATAVKAAQPMDVVLFRELTVMSTSILQGKVARLPVVHALRGTAVSHAAPHNSDAMRWILHDAESFFAAYLTYRNGLVRFVRERGIHVPPKAKLEQILDMSHGSWLARELDVSKINHARRLLLNETVIPIIDPPWTGGQPLAPGDVAHAAANGRRYIWRKTVTQAEPREEIRIGESEMARVEQQLDEYRLSN
jgi:glycosyltransferase domain-containing protein